MENIIPRTKTSTRIREHQLQSENINPNSGTSAPERKHQPE
ncbi:hypothetical protein [Lentibacillus sp. Marseille-P4043]|nr:hypothetical protein [Lentibacillus sp. Marseille-P4043]